MTDVDAMYLALVAASMVIFAVVLAYAAWVAPGDDRTEG